eukprot:COSAG02_NODE_198_length_29564_cov_12.279009_17_plen_99_part_00
MIFGTRSAAARFSDGRTSYPAARALSTTPLTGVLGRFSNALRPLLSATAVLRTEGWFTGEARAWAGRDFVCVVVRTAAALLTCESESVELVAGGGEGW